MALSKEAKSQLIKDYAIKEGDTGSAAVQVAILTAEINELNGHLKEHKHDYHSRRGLLAKVSRRKRLLEYLKKNDVQQYTALIARLGLRR